MKFPNELKLKIISKDKSQPIVNHILMLEVFAKEKNNYNVCLRLTDNNGVVKIKEDEVVYEIEWDRKMFIMDYLTPYEACSDQFEIILLSKEMLNNAKAALELYLDMDYEFLSKDLNKVIQGENSLIEPVKWTLDCKNLTNNLVLKV